MIRLKVLGSSSSGNAYILDNGKTSIMLDCGANDVINEDFSKIDAILLTHKHGDHIKQIPKIKDLFNGKYYSHQDVLDALPVLESQKAIIKTEEKFQVGTFSCTAFELMHDVTNFGYLIKDEISNYKFLYITDTGAINYRFKDIDCFLIESNCDENSLTYEDFKEIRLYNTHLSMQQCANFLKNNVNHNTKKILLCHISKEEDLNKHVDHIRTVIGNEKIEVKAIDPTTTKGFEIVLKEDLRGFNFD